jgi:hypothetical protein
MKKHVLMLALAITFCTTGLMAQGISGGFKAGLNFANQKFESDGFDFNPDGRIAFHAGFFATINMGTIGLQPELLYNSVGSKADLGSLGEVVTKIDYLTVPVMVRFNFAKICNLHAGPTFGFLLSAKQEFDGDSEDIKEDLKGMDLGLGLGFGLDLPMGLTAGIRYNLGLGNASDVDDVDIKNNVVQLSVGYKLFGE